MLVFIDDSGDAGFKIDKGSSQFFVIALIIFDDELEAEKTAVAIKDFRRLMKFSDVEEFKFHKSSKSVREGFLKAINPLQFKVRCLVIDKKAVRSDELKTNKNSFYSYVIKMALKHSGNSIFNAKVKIDGSGDRAFRKGFLAYLRKELTFGQRKIMQNCKLVNSNGNVLIQMADMVAGSILRSYSDKTDSDLYIGIIRKHIEDKWNFK